MRYYIDYFESGTPELKPSWLNFIDYVILRRTDQQRIEKI